MRFVMTMRHIGDKHQEQTLTSRRAAAEARVAAESVLGKRKERTD